MAAPLARSPLVTADSTSTVGTAITNSVVADSTSGTPNTTPPASRSRSPENSSAKQAAASAQQIDEMEPIKVKNMCFVGAGFVGMSPLPPAQRKKKATRVRGKTRGLQRVAGRGGLESASGRPTQRLPPPPARALDIQLRSSANASSYQVALPLLSSPSTTPSCR